MATGMPNMDPSTIPLAPDPHGGPPNFVDPPSLQPVVIGVGLTMIITSGFFMILRLYTNIRNTGKLGADDFTQQMLIGPTIWAAKAAILALYIRVFGPVRWLRITSYGLIIFMFLFYWSNVAIAGAYCIPRNGSPWNATTFAKCAEPALDIVVGILDVATDLVLYFLPFPVINKLQLAPRKLLGLRVVFLVGFIAVIGSTASLAYKVKVFRGNDSLWNGISVAITTFVEVHLTVIVSCAPALSSFWINIVTRSQWYSSLRSGASSWALHSKDRKAESMGYPQKAIGHETASLPLKSHHAYDELYDGGSDHVKGVHTDKDASAGTYVPMAHTITKSTHIVQSSEHV
ncbi:MAG: hypothetical protein Q9194_002114 [Teloschistes cf. exilis]